MSDVPSTSQSAPKRPRRIENHRQDFDEETQIILEDIDKYQTEIDTFTNRASVEILVIEQKYNEVKKPLFDKRTELIAHINNFWFTAIINHPDLRELVRESEEDCLQHLNNLEVEVNEEVRTGYTIRFYFAENPYFENEVLTKIFRFGNKSFSSESTKIVWKEGYDLTHTYQATSYQVGSKRKFHQRSFFSWFTEDIVSSPDTTDDIGELIKDDLWNNPLQYYLVPDDDGDENGIEDDSSSSSDSDGDDDAGDDGVDKKPDVSSGGSETA